MPEHCVAYSCTNRRTIKSRARGITFHKFPKKDVRKKWEVALRREGFTATDSSVLCSDHFKSDDFDRTGQIVRLRDGVIPSIFSFPVHFQRDSELQKNRVLNIRQDHFRITDVRVCSRHLNPSDLIEPSNPGGCRRLKKRAVPVLFEWNSSSLPATRPGVWDRTERPHPPAPEDTLPNMDVARSDHDYCSCSEPAALDPALDETEDLRAENAKLRKQMEEMAISCKFGLERFSSSDEDIRLYTRFASYARLMSFWSQIEPALPGLVHVTRARTATKTVDDRQSVHAAFLQPIDEFFLFMTYLSLDLVQSDLANRFGIHQSTVSCIINTWANFLYNVLGAVGIWLDEETINKNMPEVFHNYSDTHVILDCTELHCQTHEYLLLQSEKSHRTFKGLIGFAPHGPVMFVSPLYEGSTSDREITKRSGLVSHLKPSMAVMVDEGFLVEDIVPCKVHTPAFLKKKAQLLRAEVHETHSTARLRVHVERVIRRVKDHKLFSAKIPLSLTGSINQLFAVACLLVNYQNGPLVKAGAKTC